MLNCYPIPIHKTHTQREKVKQNQEKVGYHTAQGAKGGMMTKT